MSKRDKLLRRALAGPRNMSFHEMVSLVEAFGFHLARVRGSHHVFAREDLPEMLNLQNVHGMAKPYQVRQFLKLVERHDLAKGSKQ